MDGTAIPVGLLELAPPVGFSLVGEDAGMGNGVRITVMREGIRLVAAMLAIGLAVGVSGPSLAQEAAAGKGWVGRRVIPKQRDFALKDAEGAPSHAAKIAVYRVDQVKGDALLLTADGGSPTGWAALGQVVPVEQAVEYFSDAIGKNPRDGYNYVMRARILLYEREDAEHALADCDEAIRLDPKDVLARRIRGATRAVGQEYGKALADFTEVIRLTPQDPDAYRDRGTARMSSQDVEGALADFNQAIQLDPKDASTYVSRAAAMIAKKENDKAIADFDEAIRLDPKNVDAYLLRASVRGQKGEFDQAIADFTQIIKIDPNVPLAYEARGTGFRNKKEYDRAIADFDQAIRLDPRNAGAYLARGLTWRDQRENDKAIADLDRALQIDPENPEAYAVRADAWADKKDFDKAVADYTRLLRLDPRNAWAYSSRGLALAEKKQYAKAVADLDRALQLDPQNPDVLNGRAWFRATCPNATYRDGAQAIASATKACELAEWKEPGLLDTLAAAYAEAGNFAAAVKWQTKAIAMDTDSQEKAGFEERLKLYQSNKPYREGKP